MVYGEYNVQHPFSSSYHHHPLYFFGLAGPLLYTNFLSLTTLYDTLPLLTRVSHLLLIVSLSGGGVAR
jgi:hypothetical protein